MGYRLKSRTALVLTILAAAGMSYYYLVILLPQTRATEAHPTVGRFSFGNDFYPVWLTSRECLPHRIDPYTPEVTRKIQTGIFGRVLSSRNPEDPPADYRAFSYPAFVDIFGLLVARLPFAEAKIVLVILLSFITVASVALWSIALNWKAGPAVLIIFAVLTFSSYPGFEALYALQPGLIVGFLLSTALAALAKNRLRWAGCLLALATIKPQVCVLLILYLLLWSLTSWRERRKFTLAFLVTQAVLIFSAMMVWPNWVAGWLKAVMNYPGYSRPPLLADLFGPYLGNTLLVLALLATAKFAWNSRKVPVTSFRFGLTVSLLLAVTTITLLPGHAFYDQVVLLPGIMMVVRFWRAIWTRSSVSSWILTLAAAALFWPWIAAPVVIFIRFATHRFTSAILFLPLRTAVTIPFLVLGLLLLVIREIRDDQCSVTLETSRV